MRPASQDGQIMVLSALVLVVVAFLVGLVTAAAQLYAASAQMEKAAVLSGRSGALFLGDGIVNAPSTPDLPALHAGVNGRVNEFALTNGAQDVDVHFNNAAEFEVAASRTVGLFFGMVPAHEVTSRVTLQVIPREDPTHAELFAVRVVPNQSDQPRRSAFDDAYNQGYEQFRTLTGAVDPWLTAAIDLPEWRALRTTQPRIYAGLTVNRLIEQMTDRLAAQFAGSGALMTWPAQDLYIEDPFTDVNMLLPEGQGLLAGEANPIPACIAAFASKGVATAPFWVEGLAVGPLTYVAGDRALPAAGSPPDVDGYWERVLQLPFKRNTIWPDPASAGAVTVDYNPCLPQVGSGPAILNTIFVDPAGHPVVEERRRSWLISSGFLEALAISLNSDQMRVSSVSDRLRKGLRSNDSMEDRTVRFDMYDNRGHSVMLSPSIATLDKAGASLKWLSGGRYVPPLVDRYWAVLERKLKQTRKTGDAEVALLVDRLRSRHEFLADLSTRQVVGGGYWALDCVVDLGPFGRPDCATEDYSQLVSFRHRSFASYAGNQSILLGAIERDVERMIRQATGVAEFRTRWPGALHLVYQEWPPEAAAVFPSILETAIRNVLTRNEIPCMHLRIQERLIQPTPAPSYCQVNNTPTPLLDGNEINQAVDRLKVIFQPPRTALGFRELWPPLGRQAPPIELRIPHGGGWAATSRLTPWDGSPAVASDFAAPGSQCKDHRVLPMAAGRVVKVGPDWAAIDHGDGNVGFYRYLSDIRVREGQSLLSGDAVLGHPVRTEGASACRVRVAVARYATPPAVGDWSPEAASWADLPPLVPR